MTWIAFLTVPPSFPGKYEGKGIMRSTLMHVADVGCDAYKTLASTRQFVTQAVRDPGSS
jgi:hypothetical protein